MKRTPSIHSSRESGFVLVVIAALFVAFAVVAAVAVERNTALQFIAKRDAANAQLSRLANAIIEYGVFARASGSPVLIYPCPAEYTLAVTDTNFGKSVAFVNGYTADCSNTTGDSATPGYTTGNRLRVMSTNVVMGMVPVQTLSVYGISLNDAFDPWNNRIMYVVNRQYTLGGTVSAANVANNPALTDIRTGYTLAQPDFILISYGRDGVGAYKKGDTTVAYNIQSIACTNGGAIARHENCDTDGTFVVGPTYTAPTATSATYFDDVLTWFRQTGP